EADRNGSALKRPPGTCRVGSKQQGGLVRGPSHAAPHRSTSRSSARVQPWRSKTPLRPFPSLGSCASISGMALALVIAALIGLPAAAQTKRKAPKTPRVLKVAKQQPFVAGGVRYAVQTIQSWQALPKVIGYEAPPPGSTFVVVIYTSETLSSDPVIVDANRFYLLHC